MEKLKLENLIRRIFTKTAKSDKFSSCQNYFSLWPGHFLRFTICSRGDNNFYTEQPIIDYKDFNVAIFHRIREII